MATTTTCRPLPHLTIEHTIGLDDLELEDGSQVLADVRVGVWFLGGEFDDAAVEVTNVRVVRADGAEYEPTGGELATLKQTVAAHAGWHAEAWANEKRRALARSRN